MKRVFDIVVSSVGLFFLWPVLLVVALLVRIFLGKGVLFVQERPGYKSKIFKIYKFRTMRNEGLETESDTVRLTKFGKLLRSTSLDELPELWNVLKGEMSLVGPRPLLVEYLVLYSKEHLRRHDVRPGITGWAQINGRNAIGWEKRLNLDLWYVDNMSFLLDLKIIFLTFFRVVQRSGVSEEGHVTKSKFKGSDGNSPP